MSPPPIGHTTKYACGAEFWSQTQTGAAAVLRKHQTRCATARKVRGK